MSFYTKKLKLISNNLFNWCSNYQVSKLINYPERNRVYFNWFNYKTDFKTYFFNLSPKFIVINYEKYNYQFIEYMCQFKFGNKISILDFCATVGYFIPHYCYHPDLSIAGNCRMCLIQLDGSIKPIASCAIHISPNMIINTQSLFVKKLQEVY